jgi:hypothetical protein
VDIAGGQARALACPADCDLPRTHVELLRLPIVRIEAQGLVRDGRASPRLPGELPWTLEIDVAELPVVLFDRDIDLVVDRSHDPAIELAVELELSSALLDGLAWDELAGEGGGPIELDGEAAASVIGALGEMFIKSRVTRGSL